VSWLMNIINLKLRSGGCLGQELPAFTAVFPNFRENECAVGLAYVDLTKRVMDVAEHLNDGQFTNMESMLMTFSCEKCLLSVCDDVSGI
jgi:DNA mismatch repair protein MSH2